MSINLEFDLVFVWNSGQHLGNRGSLDPRRAAKSFKGPINAMSESLHVGSFAPGACDLKSEHVTWIESGRHAAQFLQAAQQQTCARQQRHRQHDLNADQNPLQRIPSRSLSPIVLSERMSQFAS